MSAGTVDLDFSKLDGLIPAVIQDASTQQVLMVGFMNSEAYKQTRETGWVHFWSRTRQSLWMKGETSGNKLRVISAYCDCDNDTVLILAQVEGDGVCCHTGAVSCFAARL